jgi:hypothetical protein
VHREVEKTVSIRSTLTFFFLVEYCLQCVLTKMLGNYVENFSLAGIYSNLILTVITQ